MSGSYVSPTSAHEHHDAEQRNRPETPDADAAETERLIYAAARTVVANTPIAVRDRALTAAAMQLTRDEPPQGPDRLPQRIDRRKQLILAAEILDEWRTNALTRQPEPSS